MDTYAIFVQISGDFVAPFPEAWFEVCRWLASNAPAELGGVYVTSSSPAGTPTVGLGARVAAEDEGEAVRLASTALWDAIRGSGLVPSDAVLDT